MTINFSELSFEELQDAVNLGKQELRKRYYELAMEKSKKVYNDLQELKNFIKDMGGDISTVLEDDEGHYVAFKDCLYWFNEKYFDPMIFFSDEFFD